MEDAGQEMAGQVCWLLYRQVVQHLGEGKNIISKFSLSISLSLTAIMIPEVVRDPARYLTFPKALFFYKTGSSASFDLWRLSAA